MTNYQTRPVPVNVIQYTGENDQEVSDWLGPLSHYFDDFEKWNVYYEGEGKGLFVANPQSAMWEYLQPGSWIMETLNGPGYYIIINEEYFQQDYEEVPELIEEPEEPVEEEEDGQQG